MAGNKNYAVQKKQEISKLNQAGELETWYRIYAVSNSGSYFHIEVPERNLSQASELLTERANILDAI